MSNLARKLQQEQQQQTVQVPAKAPEKRHSILTPGEKFLMFVFGVTVCFGATFMVSKQAAIYEVNKEIQLVEGNIQKQQKINSDLENQISELSTYERIKQVTEKLGLTLNENNVKGVEN
ncbi:MULTISPECIES: cell division protein FtsL [Mesobacillus]|uniref:Cell division protein FtsL n=2 Tax=Mesobacillus TaxID=2675231 RepID=A0A0D6Z8J6_9BACI|nr:MULTISPECIES: cell division protein FtsL [Mesobacillus]KIY21316.1 cell division protein [Mesobacillus subterraneus]MDQ0414873.1 cell division protein FtsL [Mesobacillus stamsii]